MEFIGIDQHLIIVLFFFFWNCFVINIGKIFSNLWKFIRFNDS